jgi:hypothetical protein
MASAPGWSSRFPMLFTALHKCLLQVDNGAAYVSAIQQADNFLTIDLYGLDEQPYQCEVTAAGHTSLQRQAATDTPLKADTLYFPRAAGAPVLPQPHCHDVESVVARPQGLIGWMAFRRGDCAL